MTRRRLLLTIAISLTAVTSAFSQKDSNIILTGLEVVPDVHTPATGSGEAWIESDTLYVSVQFENLKSPYYSAHVYYGEEGENGNPIYSLSADLSDDHKSGSFNPEKNKFALSQAMKDAFTKGNLYISISSNRHKRGEIRGQIDGY